MPRSVESLCQCVNLFDCFDEYESIVEINLITRRLKYGFTTSSGSFLAQKRGSISNWGETEYPGKISLHNHTTMQVEHVPHADR